MLFGQKRERFEKAHEIQLSLLFDIDPVITKQQEEKFEQKRTKERTKQESNHKGRMALPEHLPVEEIEIYPEGDLKFNKKK